jgi:citronellol/citronellal dehydrogenase
MKFGRSDAELATMELTFRDGLFAGQAALVTGGGRGIGKAIAFQLARLGARLAITGRNVERLEASAAALRGIGAEVIAIPMSIRNPEQAQATVASTLKAFGRLDLLVNNAGGQFPQAAIDFKPKGWLAVIDTNLNGTWWMMQAAARHWHAVKTGGVIVNIVAVVDRGMPGIAHSAAARAGVIALSKTVAVEWAPVGIRVNCVAPGVIATEGMEVYGEEARRSFPRSNVMQRFGDVRDVTDAVCYLAGPSGSFITGEVLRVDGGSHVWGEQWTIPQPDYFKTK